VCCSSSSSSQKSYILSIASLSSSLPVPARTHGGLEEPQDTLSILFFLLQSIKIFRCKYIIILISYYAYEPFYNA
jgi:hypothetical protein